MHARTDARVATDDYIYTCVCARVRVSVCVSTNKKIKMYKGNDKRLFCYTAQEPQSHPNSPWIRTMSEPPQSWHQLVSTDCALVMCKNKTDKKRIESRKCLQLGASNNSHPHRALSIEQWFWTVVPRQSGEPTLSSGCAPEIKKKITRMA